jgi:hypothetical protein
LSFRLAVITMRHNDGDIWRSIEINQKRFGYSDELKAILQNTVVRLGMCNDPRRVLQQTQ